ncbi:unnamed protein product [Lepeophtheirus salmonis]|uniref:(salmon louse) hypothetical protein n=1 Tax=Lepeophtheirus salmonis TaxID=72036 RepID=A0A7R8CHG1_LEPSM|nr:unnamed protein product [Lepeophtheirus salmonis]CAF2823955.1 unnamed protein product [Lepeophtheirus salmonis]
MDVRSLSLFSVVTFDNVECTGSASKKHGICFTSDECTENGGSADGNCASGFGVCCTFTVSTCGTTVSRNLTYVTNPSYPSSYTTTGTCTFTINRVNDNICQIRLDFDTLVLTEPATGECSSTNTDKLTFTSPSGFVPPGTGGLCGDSLSGDHMYIETGLTGSVGMSFAIGSATGSRTWKIKVTQIECGTSWKAPEDCAQYFTGISGEFQSYNNVGDQTLQSQNYKYCIRQEAGMCGIQYTSVEMDLDATIDAASQSVDATDADICPITAIRIPGVVGAKASEFCGSILSVGNEATINGALTTYSTPFVVSYFTTTGTTLATFNGFKLKYTQIPC